MLSTSICVDVEKCCDFENSFDVKECVDVEHSFDVSTSKNVSTSFDVDMVGKRFSKTAAILA